MAHYLNNLFSPASIAVIGANDNPNSIGGKVFRNLLKSNFEGTLYAINPKHKAVQNQICYSSITDIKEPISLAIIATPADTVPAIIKECGDQGIRSAIVLSAGFSETDESGKILEKAMLEEAHRHRIHVLGPNCLGIMRPATHMNATFDNNFAIPGHLALVSQSAAICTTILNSALEKQIGFSTIVSLGNGADINFGDVLNYLAFDQTTKNILLYIETIHQSRHFMNGLRAAAKIKPVIVLSHTGESIGDDDVFDAALHRAGALRVRSVEELFLAGKTLSKKDRANDNPKPVIPADPQIPDPLPPPDKIDIEAARTIIQQVITENRTLLTPVESKNILKAFCIPVSDEPLPNKPNNRELCISVIQDKIFGPVITFGAGGGSAGTNETRALELPPLNQLLAEQLISRSPIAKTLAKTDNLLPVNIEKIITILLSVSEMVSELPHIQEININPLIANENQVIAVDAKIVVADVAKAQPYSHLAIQPYPHHLAYDFQLADNTIITIRPIRPEDAEIESEFTNNLSPESKYFRFLNSFNQLSQAMLLHFTQFDYDTEIALIAVRKEQGQEYQIGEGRFIINPDGQSCDFAIAIADEWHGKGIGRRLMNSLIEIAKTKQLHTMTGVVLSENVNMLAMMEHLGFDIKDSEDPETKIVTKLLM